MAGAWARARIGLRCSWMHDRAIASQARGPARREAHRDTRGNLQGAVLFFNFPYPARQSLKALLTIRIYSVFGEFYSLGGNPLTEPKIVVCLVVIWNPAMTLPF